MTRHTAFGPFPDTEPRERSTVAHGRTLAALLELLGPHTLHLVCAPHGVDGSLSEPVIHDVGERVPEHQDGVLLAVGGSPARADTLDTIRQAGAAHYRAVVIKARGEDYAAAAFEANAAGVCLLVSPDDTPWRYIDSLIVTALGASSWTGDPSYQHISAGDLFEVANAVACHVGGAATIEDASGQVLAHSNLPHQETDEARKLSILNRRPPCRHGSAAAYERVRHAHGAVRVHSGDAEHWDRLAVAVKAGGEVLGLLWVLDRDAALDDEAAANLEEAAKVVALHLVRAKGPCRPHEWSRRTALTSLLEGRIAEQAAGDRLGIGMDTASVVLAVAQIGDMFTRGMDSNRVLDLVNVYCDALHPQATCAVSDDTVYALVPAQSAQGPTNSRLLQFAEDVAHAVQRTTSTPVHVGIAGPAPQLKDVPACRRTADLVLKALAARSDQTQVATVERVHSRVVLLELLERGATSIAVLADPVQAIVSFDQRHHTTYGESLLAYLDAFGEAAKAAAELSIHENTLRYRIRRIQELFDLDLSDAETRLVTWLRLKLQNIDG